VTMCLSTNSTYAQESKQKCTECKKCQECPANQTSVARAVEFSWPGVGIHVAVDTDGSPDDAVEGCIECNCIVESAVPFHSNIPYVNRLFKNVGIKHESSCKFASQAPCDECDKCEVCPMAKKSASNGFHSKTPHGIQMVGYIENSEAENNSPSQIEMREEMFELRLQNERLKMEVEAAQQQLEMMEAVMELREENASLRARVELFESHHRGGH